jgi:hypothetical protein
VDACMCGHEGMTSSEDAHVDCGCALAGQACGGSANSVATEKAFRSLPAPIAAAQLACLSHLLVIFE